MEKIIYLLKRVSESEELANLKPAIAKAQKIAGRDLNSINGLLKIAQAFSIKVVLVGDLPEQVSGYSDIIDGERYIFLNRNRSGCHLIHTMQHELGHHLLDHLCPDKLKNRIAEFEAPVFASLLFLLGDIDYNHLTQNFDENPELRLYGFLIGAGALSLVAAGIIWELVDWVATKLADS